MMGLSASLQGPSADAWVASHAGQLLSCLPAHGEEVVKLAEQLGLSLIASTGELAGRG